MKNNILPPLIVSLLVAHFTVVASGADSNWPQFRGPGGAGSISDGHIPERWSTNEHVAWKADISGKGWSSPIV